MDKVYLNRIIECVGDMCKNGKIQDTTLFEREYGLPHLSIENLSNEPEASIRKIIDALSEKDNASKIYIQTGNRSKIIDNNPIQVGDRNLFGRVARQGKGVGDVVLIVVGDVGTQAQPEGDQKAEQPGIADAKAGDHHCRHGTDQTADHPPQTLADDPAHGGKAHHGGRGHGPVRGIQLQDKRQPERQAHGQAVAQGITPLATAGLAPGGPAPE